MALLFDNVTILLEGELDPDINLHETLETYVTICNIVLSVKDTDIEQITKICESFPTIKIIGNDINEYRKIPLRIDQQFKNHTAISLLSGYFQICSTKKGLEYINTDYVIKSKLNHYYYDIGKFIKYGLASGKIISSSLFQRGCKDGSIANRARYCLSDTLFMGKTNEIKKCFDLCYEEKVLTRVATGIWSPYFIDLFKKDGIDINSVDDETYVQFMMKVVDIYSVNEFGPYKFKYFDSIRTHMWDKIKTTHEYLMYGFDS